MNNKEIITKIEYHLLSEPTSDFVEFRDWEEFDRRIQHFQKDLPNLRNASVLIPVLEDNGELFVLLTERARHMKTHAGQISFPGGGQEAFESLQETALREAEEEIGLPPNQVRPLGYLPQYPTISGYQVTPVVGFINGSFTPRLQTEEVVSLIRVPFSYLMNPENHSFVPIELHGETALVAEINYANNRIWGATAGMILNFYETIHPLNSL